MLCEVAKPPNFKHSKSNFMFKKNLSPFTRKLMLAAVITAPLLASGQVLAAGDIAFTADQAYPEGIAWSPKQKVFFVSSVHKGVIGKVTPQGAYTPFIKDDKLVASVGLLLDTKRNLLWTAIGDLGASTTSGPATTNKLAAVAAYDATTGERRAYHDLSKLVDGGHFANDLALDAQGNIYVTDSFAPAIYRIDAKGVASVFATSDLFKGEGFNLNGIVSHPDGYLLVNKYNSGEIFRISTRNGADIQRVNLSEALKGADGMLLRDKNRLTVVQNSGNDQVVELVSKDGWKSATLQPARKTAYTFPTTVAQVGKNIYVLNSRLDTLLTKDAVKVSDYLLQKF
jgi:sugar lactone lactonase YvrE